MGNGETAYCIKALKAAGLWGDLAPSYKNISYFDDLLFKPPAQTVFEHLAQVGCKAFADRLFAMIKKRIAFYWSSLKPRLMAFSLVPPLKCLLILMMKANFVLF